MAKEDKDKILQLAYELDEKERTFTDEEIIQLTEWKMEAEKLAARDIGLEEGRAEGREEGIKAKELETVKNMFAENLDIELISKITNLTKEEIIKIKENL